MAGKAIKFMELADLLEAEFAQRPIGAPATTLNELIDRFQVSRGTAKRTLLELQQRGLIYSRVGAGSFIAPPSRKKLILIAFELNNALVRNDMFNQEFLVRALIRCNMNYANYTVAAIDFADLVQHADHLETLHPRLKGVILLRYIAPYRDIVLALQKRGIACAFYGSSTHRDQLRDIDHLIYDEEEVMKLALNTLHERGCRKPGFIGRQDFPVFQERFKYFRKHAVQLGMAYTSQAWLDPMLPDSDSDRNLRRYFCELDSIVSGDDRGALHFAQRAQQLGFRVPEDLALIGINHAHYLDWVSPGITTVSICTEDDTDLVLDRMMRRIEKNEPFRESTPLRLTRRTSC